MNSMKITACEHSELFRLYSDAGLDVLSRMVRDLVMDMDGKTYRITTTEEDSDLLVTIAFCDSGDGRTDLVVAGYATSDHKVEQISPRLINYLVQVLRENPTREFDIVSVTCLTRQHDDPQMAWFLDQSNPGYRAIVMTAILPGLDGYARIRLAHDAVSLRKAHDN